MLATALRTTYDYHRWATAKILDAAEQLTPDQLNAPGGAGRGSVRETLLHMIGTLRNWSAWWDGSLPPAQAYAQRLDPADFPDIASVRALWETVDRRVAAFVAGLTDEHAARIYTAPRPGGEWSIDLWKMMLHVANHGTQHRSEIAAQLTDFGQSPGDLDMVLFFD